MRDPYAVLGVSKDASSKDIKSAFRKLAKKYHPDQNPDDPKAQEQFAQANGAYEIVGDEQKRKAFDRGEIDAEGKPRFQGFEGAGAGGDPFANFRRRSGDPGMQWEFRSGGPGAGPGAQGGAGPGGFDQDIFSELFGQAFSGGPQQGSPFSRGSRRAPSRGDDISATLEISLEEAATGAKVQALFPNGKRIAVKLPDYVEDGQTIRLKGQGEEGLAGPGDALVQLKIRANAKFRAEGRDIHADVPVPLRDAVLGGKVSVETLTGRLALTVPAWSSSDKVLRLKGQGMPEKNGGKGDLYAHLRVMLPEGGDEGLEAFLRAAD